MSSTACRNKRVHKHLNFIQEPLNSVSRPRNWRKKARKSDERCSNHDSIQAGNADIDEVAVGTALSHSSVDFPEQLSKHGRRAVRCGYPTGTEQDERPTGTGISQLSNVLWHVGCVDINGLSMRLRFRV